MSDRTSTAARVPLRVSLFSPVLKVLLAAGVPVGPNGLITIRGRKSGLLRTTPVAIIAVSGRRWVWCPWGDVQWVRNLRVAKQGELRVGRRTERFVATEVPDDEKPPILRAYLQRWKAEVGVFFSGVSATSSEADVHRIAPDHPVFRIREPG